MITRRNALLSAASALGMALTAQGSAVQRQLGPVLLSVSGLIGPGFRDRGVDWDLAMLDALPQSAYLTRTPWDEVPKSFSRPLLRDVLLAVEARGQALRAQALNDYSARIPLVDVEEHDVLLATRVNGQPVPVRARGPLMIMYPFDRVPALQKAVYFERCVWQLRRLVVV